MTGEDWAEIRRQHVREGMPVRALVIPVSTNALIAGHQVATVPARVISSGIFESMHQLRKRCSR